MIIDINFDKMMKDIKKTETIYRNTIAEMTVSCSCCVREVVKGYTNAKRIARRHLKNCRVSDLDEDNVTVIGQHKPVVTIKWCGNEIWKNGWEV